MGSPPEEVYRPRPVRARAPSFVLVSVGIGQRFERSLERLNQSALATGFDRVLLWREADLLQDSLALQHREALNSLQREHLRSKAKHSDSRPYCAAFKPLIMWRALVEADDDDFVLWSDSSQWHPEKLRAGVREAADALTTQTPRSAALPRVGRAWGATEWFQQHTRSGTWASRNVTNAVGVISCSSRDCEMDTFQANYRGTVINRETIAAFRDLVPGGDSTALRRPHVLNSNILLRNSVSTRLLVWDWLMMAITHPHGFCSSHTNDQAAWTLLVQNRSMPLINPCVYLGTLPPAMRNRGCERHYKKHNTFFDVLRRGLYEIIDADSYDNFTGDLFGPFARNTWIHPELKARKNRSRTG